MADPDAPFPLLPGTGTLTAGIVTGGCGPLYSGWYLYHMSLHLGTVLMSIPCAAILCAAASTFALPSSCPDEVACHPIQQTSIRAAATRAKITGLLTSLFNSRFMGPPVEPIPIGRLSHLGQAPIGIGQAPIGIGS